MVKKELVIIGGGPGGYVAAIKAAQQGLKVTLVEKEEIGGTCLNRGCIPTKALLRSASLLEETEVMKSYGVTARDVEFDLGGAMKWKERVIKRLIGGVKGLLQKNGVEVLSGFAAFTGPNTLEVNGEPIEFSRAIIATGSMPARPPIPGIDGDNVLFSRDALSLQQAPKRLAIIGGGVIGVELASVFKAAGSKVTVIEALPSILPAMDKDLANGLEKVLKKKGIKVFTGAKVTDILEDRVNMDIDGKTEEVLCDKVLVAVGVRPAIDGIGLDKAGIAFDRKGILVNESMETNVPGIYAVGDAVPTPQLAHVASEEGLVAVDGILGSKRRMKYNAVPYCVYTNPELAAVGLTEEMAQRKGIGYSVGVFPLMANGKAMVEGVRDGFVKIMADEKNGKILGVHIMAPHACEMIQLACVALTLGASVEDLLEVIYPHPTMGEAIFEAALLVKGKAIHI
jgi:dihydrolipoamide dehydrogenase